MLLQILFLCVPLSTTGKESQIKLLFKHRHLHYMQIGGERDNLCQGQVLIDDGCSTNEAASHRYGSCSRVPLRGAATKTDRTGPLCCQNIPCGDINNKSSSDPLSLNLFSAHIMFGESDSAGKTPLIK